MKQYISIRFSAKSKANKKLSASDLTDVAIRRALTSDELLDLIGQGEGLRIEFKSTFLGSIEGQDKILQALCGFANTEGGIVFVGVQDNGQILGARKELLDQGKNDSTTNQRKDDYRRRALNLVRDRMKPLLGGRQFQISFIDIQDDIVVQLSVAKSNEPTYLINAKTGANELFISNDGNFQSLDALKAQSYLKNRLNSDSRLDCEISFGDALLVFDARAFVEEFRVTSLSQARTLQGSVGNPKTTPTQFAAILKQFHGPETRSKEEFLQSVLNWLAKFSDFISRWIGWKSHLVIPQGNCIELTNRTDSAIRDLQVEIRVSPPIIVWRKSDLPEDEPTPPSSPDPYGQRSLIYGFTGGFDHPELFRIQKFPSKLETEVTQTDSDTVIKFYVDAIRGEQTVVLDPIWVAVTDDRASIKTRWTMTSLNLKGVVKGETDWTLRLVQ